MYYAAINSYASETSLGFANTWGVWGTVDGEILCVYVRANSRDTAINLVRQEETE